MDANPLQHAGLHPAWATLLALEEQAEPTHSTVLGYLS